MLLVLACLVAAYFIIESRGEITGSESHAVIFIGVPRFYAGYSAAAIIRLDDFTADPASLRYFLASSNESRRVFENYDLQFINFMTKEHPEVRVVFGIVTADFSGENNSWLWSLYDKLVKEYKWEAASHTRYHLKPPRTLDDIVGSIRDIEGNITGYKVRTYIPPYGKVTTYELSLLRKNGIDIVMGDKPYQLRIPSYWYNLGITVKLSDRIPWEKFLIFNKLIAEHINGVLVIYTHPTSFDWNTFSDMEKALNTTISIIEDGRIWITTPSELYDYLKLEREISVSKINETAFSIKLKEKTYSGSVLPITVIFEVKRNVTAVETEKGMLSKLSAPGYVPKEGFFLSGNRLYVNVIPPATINIMFGNS